MPHRNIFSWFLNKNNPQNQGVLSCFNNAFLLEGWFSLAIKPLAIKQTVFDVILFSKDIFDFELIKPDLVLGK